MPERKIFSSKDLTVASVTNPDRYPGLFDGEELYNEIVWFGRNNWADVRMLLAGGTLKWVDNVVICLDQGISLYYDHNCWAPPFGLGFQPPELKGSYPAVIHIDSVSEAVDRRVRSEVKYGCFWYGQDGKLQAVNCGYITQSEFEPNTPFLNLYRLDQDRWQIYRMRDIFEAFDDYYLEGKKKMPENQLLYNGREIVIDEIVTRITDDGQVVRLHQETLVGHKQKTITVPSTIDLVRWVDSLKRVNGEWTKIFSDFPCQIELQT